MKKTVTICMTALVCLSAQTVNAQYKIEGSFKNIERKIHLVACTPNGLDTLASTFVDDKGHFTIKGKVSEPTAACIRVVDSSIRIPVILEKSTVHVDADLKDPMKYKISGGGKLQQLRNEFHNTELQIYTERDSAKAVIERDFGKEDFFAIAQIRALFDQYREKLDKAEDAFAKQHDNIVSASLLVWRVAELMKTKTLPARYEALGENARQTVPGRWLKPYSDQIACIIVGGTAPDLQMKTPDGSPISIYGIKAKAKILDFWASWCGPCRAESPNIMNVYKKYKDKGLEVIGISLDERAELWKKAIQHDSITWPQMSDLRGWNSIAAEKYRLVGIPQIYLLDENNRIVGEGLRGKEIEEAVAKLLGPAQ